jgi:opacity protein-like surface antigen
MKIIIIALAGWPIFFSIFSPAYAASGPYVSGSFGLSMPRDCDVTDATYPTTLTLEADDGLTFGGAAGYFWGNMRIEGEITYQKNDLDQVSIPGIISTAIEGDITSTSFLLNGYYDFKNTSPFIPFIGAGIGGSRVKVSTITVPGYGVIVSCVDDTVFAYQLSAGIAYAVSEMVVFDIKYRYFVTSDMEYDDREYSGKSHNVYVAMRILF